MREGYADTENYRDWSRETISKLLRNEKYVGDVLLQKIFVQDIFLGK